LRAKNSFAILVFFFHFPKEKFLYSLSNNKYFNIMK